MIDYLRLIRVKHWFKNFLIFLPLVFSLNLFNMYYFVPSFLAFFVFCISSSIVYVINDISDIEKDRKHPIKKNRPLASGKISVKNAKLLIIFLVFIDICLFLFMYYNNSISFIKSISIPFIYIIMNILYSKKLKNIPIIDVFILMLGFLFRVLYGGLVINIFVSKWLYLMIVFGSFYMGFGKRRNEIIKNGSNSRKVLSLYSKEFLDKNMYVALGLAIVSYSLWSVDSETITRVGNDYLFWTIPLVMVILQLYSLNIEGDSHGDPIEVILSDKLLLGSTFVYGAVMILLLYVI